MGKKYTYKGFGFEDIDYVVMEIKPGDMALRKALGMDLPTAFRMFMARNKIVKGLPFEATLLEIMIAREESRKYSL